MSEKINMVMKYTIKDFFLNEIKLVLFSNLIELFIGFDDDDDDENVPIVCVIFVNELLFDSS
jgi:hypothetical protein